MTPRFSRRLAVALALAGIVSAGRGHSAPLRAEPARLDLSQPWVVATPDEVEMDGPTLAAAAGRAATIPRFRSLLVARHGRLVVERYFAGTDATTLFDVRSVTKSVVSALTGIALGEGSPLALDASIAPYLSPPYAVDAADAGVTVRHLLTMTSGFQWDEDTQPDYNRWIVSNDHVQYLLDRPHAYLPGTQFTYNSAGAHVLGVVLERATGTRLAQYANDRLFTALGSETVVWEALDRSTVNGGAGIELRGRDLLKLGQLFLQRGWSAERSVVPETWVDEATRPQFPWRFAVGAQQGVTYGMLFWVSDAEPQAFFAWGYGGQFVFVVPTLDLTVVTTTEWRSITETTPGALAAQALDVIVQGVLPAVR